MPVILSAKRKGSDNMKQILIVEDDNLLNKTLTYNLELDGYTITSVLNARTAAESLKTNIFDLVLLDINLPDGNGYDLCRLIKPEHPDTVVIFLTANDQESDQIRGYEAGAVDYITKPFSISALQRKIKAVYINCALCCRFRSFPFRRRSRFSARRGVRGKDRNGMGTLFISNYFFFFW